MKILISKVRGTHVNSNAHVNYIHVKIGFMIRPVKKCIFLTCFPSILVRGIVKYTEEIELRKN